MINWLSTWLQEIILIILLAVFIDLLLPNSSMQRYVKVVISLFILLAILSPIINLLRSDINLNSLSIPTGASNEIQSVNAIMKEGERISSLNEQYSIEIIEEQIAEQIKTQLSQTLDESIYQVSVKAQTGDAANAPQITHIQVALEQAAESDMQRTSDQWVEVEPIEPVHIHINLDEPYHREGQEVDHNHAKMQETTEQIHLLLTQLWDITPDAIEVIYLNEETSNYD